MDVIRFTVTFRPLHQPVFSRWLLNTTEIPLCDLTIHPAGFKGGAKLIPFNRKMRLDRSPDRKLGSDPCKHHPVLMEKLWFLWTPQQETFLPQFLQWSRFSLTQNANSYQFVMWHRLWIGHVANSLLLSNIYHLPGTVLNLDALFLLPTPSTLLLFCFTSGPEADVQPGQGKEQTFSVVP